MSNTVATFEQSLDRLDVDVARVAPGDLADALDSVLRPPAVGVPLPFEGTALPPSVTVDPTPAELDAATTGVTPAGLGVADYGSVLLQSRPDGTEPISLYPDLHVAVLRADDVVPGMAEAFEWLADEVRTGYGSAIFATGPSATADMGALVKGAHGPKEVFVALVDDGADASDTADAVAGDEAREGDATADHDVADWEVDAA